jgi:hypothetical protein
MPDKKLALFMHGEFGEAKCFAEFMTLDEFIEYKVSPHPEYQAMIPKEATSVIFEHHNQDGTSYGGVWGRDGTLLQEEELFCGTGFVLVVDGKELVNNVVLEDKDEE